MEKHRSVFGFRHRAEVFVVPGCDMEHAVNSHLGCIDIAAFGPGNGYGVLVPPLDEPDLPLFEGVHSVAARYFKASL